ncbi:MAG: hypothetical protein JXA09_04775 [Anaerolineae bacterium]|nr:hypothetical protein [Anaerolineae bacterium]
MGHKQLTIRVRVDLAALWLLAIGLALIALTGSTAWAAGDGSVMPALEAQAATARGFYLTVTEAYTGIKASNACAAGYHMASLWEIWDVTNLVYDQDWGYAAADAGEGPPSNVTGWVRTGYHSPDGSPGSPGVANCMAWTSDSVDHYGTVVMLGANWDNAGVAISPWRAVLLEDSCDTPRRVWCVED